MQNKNLPAQQPKHVAKAFFENQDVKKKFEELLNKRASGFITSVLQVVASDDKLSKAEPATIYHAAITAAVLDLPINKNFGFAYILAYNQKQSDGSYKQVAQFQMGYKGFIQLAQRSGLYKTISSTPIYEGQIKSQDPLQGYEFDFTVKPKGEPIGYAAYFRLTNGFEKTAYATREEIIRHAEKYSQGYKQKGGIWHSDFDGMAQKTVLKLLISKFGPLSVEMQKAIITDQAVINNEEATDITYVDNEVVDVNKEEERIMRLIQNASTIEELESYQQYITTEAQRSEYQSKGKQIIDGI